ncbi:MAG: alpha/beta fold hydrolase [Halieaceae bacterium]|jgi:pimeloyl-ACP methyl ester carboxylesterase|nr:alpha/beta fold hydrolase [Halieaceae bacterium]
MRTSLKVFTWGTGLAVLAWLLASCIWGPKLAVQMAANPVTSSPADVGVAYQNVRVSSDGLELEGWWMPAENPKGVVLFVHGAGSNRTSWFLPSLEFYQMLVGLDLSVISIDLRNHGNSPKTDGELGMGAKEWPDLIAVSHWVDAQGYSELPKIGVSLSMGGATTIYAVHEGLALDAAVLIDPLLNTTDALMQGGWVAFGLPPGLFAPMAWSATRMGELPYGALDAGILAESMTIPTLLIQDPDDPITRLPFAQKLASANSNIALAIAPAVTTNHACINAKGRWGTHVAAFKCHESWTVEQLSEFLSQNL